jgi:hypothetical protein
VGGTTYIKVINNKANKPVTLLRECLRQDGKVIKRTLANLSALPDTVTENLRLALKGGSLTDLNDIPGSLITKQSTPWGNGVAVLDAVSRLNIAELQEKDIIIGLLAEHILNPKSQLATAGFRSSRSLASEPGIEDCDVDDIRSAVDWLLERKDTIELRLPQRHLRDGDMIFLDVSSSYYEGQKSKLAGNESGTDVDDSKMMKTREVFSDMDTIGIKNVASLKSITCWWLTRMGVRYQLTCIQEIRATPKSFCPLW